MTSFTTFQLSLPIVTSAAAPAGAGAPTAGSALEALRGLGLSPDSVFASGVFFFSLDPDLSLVRRGALGGEIADLDLSGSGGSEGGASEAVAMNSLVAPAPSN